MRLREWGESIAGETFNKIERTQVIQGRRQYWIEPNCLLKLRLGVLISLLLGK
jgi:hypothetical protein